MRKQDKQYIANLVEQTIGRSLMNGIRAEARMYNSARDLRLLLEPVIMPSLEIMSDSKLGEIIGYSDVTFRGEHSGIICREPMIDTRDSSAYSEIGAKCAVAGGKYLLRHLALLTVLAVAFDMIKQEFYRTVQSEEDCSTERHSRLYIRSLFEKQKD